MDADNIKRKLYVKFHLMDEVESFWWWYIVGVVGAVRVEKGIWGVRVMEQDESGIGMGLIGYGIDTGGDK